MASEIKNYDILRRLILSNDKIVRKFKNIPVSEDTKVCLYLNTDLSWGPSEFRIAIIDSKIRSVIRLSCVEMDVDEDTIGICRVPYQEFFDTEKRNYSYYPKDTFFDADLLMMFVLEHGRIFSDEWFFSLLEDQKELITIHDVIEFLDGDYSL